MPFPTDMILEALGDLLRSYRSTLEFDRRILLEQYEIADFARKVVGVGSVGTRAFIGLLLGRDGQDPLFLQAKEADASVLEEFVRRSKLRTHGAMPSAWPSTASCAAGRSPARTRARAQRRPDRDRGLSWQREQLRPRDRRVLKGVRRAERPRLRRARSGRQRRKDCGRVRRVSQCGRGRFLPHCARSTRSALPLQILSASTAP